MTKSTQLSQSMQSRVFRTELGWMALVTSAKTVCKLTFAHDTRKAAEVQVDPGRAKAANNAWIESLVERLRDYASGRPVAFDDFEIDTRAMTDFGRRVIRACRKISYGHTLTYGELAARAGSSGAARAVGSQMSKNRVPLIVPCHRVLAAGSELGGYSASGGVELKRRLLEMENSRLRL